MELAANLKSLEGVIDESELELIRDVVEKHLEQIRVACLRMERPIMVEVRTASRGDLVDLGEVRGMMPGKGSLTTDVTLHWCGNIKDASYQA